MTTMLVLTLPQVAIAFTLDPATVVQLILAFILPVIVGLVTTRVTSSGRKAVLLALLTLVASLLTELARALAEGQTYDVGVALLAALPAFTVSVASHYGLWKPAGVADAARDTLVTAPDDAEGSGRDYTDSGFYTAQHAAEDDLD